MTEDPKKERAALDHLANALVDDILNTPDEDILAEVVEDNGAPEKIAEKMRALFERTIQEEGKAKLAAAKKAVAEGRRRGEAVVNIDPAEGRRRYEAMISNDPDLSKKLTMAARKGEGQSERDIESAIEDLAELGALDDKEDDDA